MSGATVGVVTGIVLAVFEAISSLPLVTGLDRAFLLLHLVAWLPFSVGLLGALVGAAAPLVSKASARLLPRYSPARALAIGLTIALSPIFLWIGYKLFSGGHMRRIGMRHVLWPATAACIAVLFAVVVALAVRLASRAREWSRRRTTVLLAALVATAALLHQADLRLFPRLYGYLHVVLALATTSTLSFAVFLAARRFAPTGRFGPRVGRALRIAVAAALVLLVLFSTLTLHERQSVRYVAFERTALQKYVMRATDTTSATDPEHERLSRAARRAIYERERRAHSAGGRYPQLPGANLLLVTVDALRADKTGFSGGTKLTPNLDRLARESVVFDRTYCQAPHSSYSITSLHTSEYIQEIVDLPDARVLPTIAQVLDASGYFTAAFYTRGIFHTEGERLTEYDSMRFGFAVADHGSRPAEAITDRAILEIDRLVSRGEPKFFLWVHYFDVHEPYRDTSLGTSPRERYEGEIMHADREIGRLLAHVERVVARDTIIAVSSDHGEEFREHGGHYHGSTLYDEQVRIPLVVHVPGGRARKVAQVVEEVDIAPTLIRLLGVVPPDTMRGHDLRPLLYDGDGAMPALPAFAAVIRKKMVVSWPYKLIADFRFDVYELYHLERDPEEKTNLYDVERSTADRLKGEIYAWMDEIRGAESHSADDNALALGRLEDRRAVPGLTKVARGEAQPLERRVEAVRLLGQLSDPRAKPTLLRLLGHREQALAVAAGTALTSLGDSSGVRLLVEATYSEDVTTRIEAARGLGNLRDRRAVPGLVEALSAEDLDVRRDAIRTLGLLRDTRAIEPLLRILPDLRMRRLVVLSLGMIGDPRSFDTLMDLLDYETHTDVRGYIVAGLGWIGDSDAADRLVRVFLEEPDLRWTAEALVRVGALEEGKVWGSDAARGAPGLVSGFGRCRVLPRFSFDEYLHQTWCEADDSGVVVRFDVPDPEEAVLDVRYRHLGRVGLAARLEMTLNGRTLDPVPLTENWNEARVQLEEEDLVGGDNEIHFEVIPPDGEEPPRLAIDHVLVVPGVGRTPPPG